MGFVFSKDKILAVFPKHYFDNSQIEVINKQNVILEEDIRLLFKAFTQYSNKKGTSVKADKYIGNEENFVSDYPFQKFYAIYDYYKKYGLYKEQEEIIKIGDHGKISWKRTIQKSNIIVSDGNLIFSPLYVKRNSDISNFLTECMAFIIDETIARFSFFINLPRTTYKKSKINYFDNISYVVRRLYEIRGKVNKDTTKLLIDNMIQFFIEYNSKCYGGRIHVKVNYFNNIWEEAIEMYLNRYFKCVDSIAEKIIFDVNQVVSKISFKKKPFDIDESSNGFSIEPDYFALDGDIMYLFDAKYYNKIDGLNYKQFSYNELLRYYGYIKKMYSILLLPGKPDVKTHFQMNKSYIGNRSYGTTIKEQYLDVKEVLLKYVM